MAVIGTLTTFSSGTLIQSAQVNANFEAIRAAFDNTAVLTDTAQTIAAVKTFAADVLFVDALYDIGKSGATRPRDGFFSRNLTAGGILAGVSLVLSGALSGATSGAFSGPVSMAGLTSTLKIAAVKAGGYNSGTEMLNAANVDSTATFAGVTAAARFSNNGSGYLVKLILSDNSLADSSITFRPSTTASLSKLGFGSGVSEQVTIDGNGLLSATAGLAVTGAVTLSSTLAVGQTTITTGGTNTARITQISDALTYNVISVNGDVTNAGHTGIAGGGGTDKNLYVDAAATADVVLRSGSSEKMRIASGGQVLIGTTVTAGASAGDLVLANGKQIRGVRPAGGLAIGLIGMSSDGYVELAGNTATVESGYAIRISHWPSASLPAANVANAGLLIVDTTNNRLCYWSNGARYYLTGTSF